jgi:NADP-dependent 3-hydroxy acid dehydrogenase YdfG
MTLRSQKVVVVGAGSGIGEAIAKMARDAGMEVVAVGRTRGKLEALAGVTVEVADVTREDEVSALFSRVGAFDHLLTTAS